MNPSDLQIDTFTTGLGTLTRVTVTHKPSGTVCTRVSANSLRARKLAVRAVEDALTGEPVCQCWNEGQYGRIHREDCPLHANPEDHMHSTATPPYTIAGFESIALDLLRRGHGRNDLIEAINKANNRRVDEAVAATYGRQA